MNIKNKEQRRRYIEIQIKDLGEFTDVALLVDNDYFLDEIEEMRTMYELHYDFPAQDSSLADDFERKMYPNSELRKSFDVDVEKIRKHFERPPHFKRAIEAAIIYGIVVDGIYSKAYLEEQELFSTEDPDEIPDKKYSIVIHAGTREDDVIRVLREFKEKVRINNRGSEEERINYKFGYWADLSLQKMSDTLGAIDTIRSWYIRTKNGEKPLQIALEELGYTEKKYKEFKEKVKILDQPNIDLLELQPSQRALERVWSKRNSIKEQLRQYRKLLKTSNRTIL